jgi:parvulin-like peptidyl-prolyl isomerase
LFWEEQVGAKVVIDSQEVIDYYRQHPENFSYPEQVDVYHILVSPLGFRQGPDSALVDRYTREDLEAFAAEYASRLYRLLLNGELFQNVAREYSHDVNSRDLGGHLGWVRPGVYIDPFDSVAFALKDGEFSEPYPDLNGVHILYRARYNPGGPLPLDSASVYEQARNAVFNQKGSAAAIRVMDSLHAASSVAINDLILTDSILYQIDDSVWVAVVNGADTIDAMTLKGFEEDYRRTYSVANTTPDIRRIMVAHAAGPVMVEQAARKLGLDTLPRQVALERQVWRETCKALMISRLYSSADWAPTDSAIEQYYQDNFDRYNPDLHFKAEQLIVADRELAEFLKEQTVSGFALKYLTEYYGPNGEGYDVKYEDLGLVTEKSVDPDLYDAMKRTHISRFTKVVKTARGYHVAKIMDRNYPRPLDVVRGEIRTFLINEHRRQFRQEYRDSLYQAFDVTFPGTLPSFELPRLSQRNHQRTLPKPISAYSS